MDDLDRISAGVLDVINAIIRLVFEGVVWLERQIDILLAPMGLGPHTQTLILLLVLLLLLLVALRLFGGTLRVLLAFIVLLVLFEALIPHGREGVVEPTSAPLPGIAPTIPAIPAPAPTPAPVTPAPVTPTPVTPTPVTPAPVTPPATQQ